MTHGHLAALSPQQEEPPWGLSQKSLAAAGAEPVFSLQSPNLIKRPVQVGFG